MEEQHERVVPMRLPVNLSKSRKKRSERQARAGRAAGFTLIETMIAIAVLSIGVLSLAATLATSLAYMNSSQYDYIAQQKAAEAVESIYTARDLGQATWSTICNVGSTVCTGGIFVNGAEPLCDPGPDEILGTADDFNGTACAVATDSIWLAGTGGTYTASSKVPLTAYGYTRTITITAYPSVANLRTITVLINYKAGVFQRSYTLTANISNFS
jgi:prepilin-type N-terminal cleavage/methylation domain-containing protein